MMARLPRRGCHKTHRSTLLQCDASFCEATDCERSYEMKILVMPKPRQGVPPEELQRHAAEEIRAVWDLYARGICREFYTRLSEPGRVVLMFECASVEEAQAALAALPFV